MFCGDKPPQTKKGRPPTLTTLVVQSCIRTPLERTRACRPAGVGGAGRTRPGAPTNKTQNPKSQTVSRSQSSHAGRCQSSHHMASSDAVSMAGSLIASTKFVPWVVLLTSPIASSHASVSFRLGPAMNNFLASENSAPPRPVLPPCPPS